MQKFNAWHFCDGWQLRDGTPLEIGRTYSVDPPIVLCEHGLHASINLIDALQYAPGDVLCRVQMWGDVQKASDKLAATHRYVVNAIDAGDLLHEIACIVAEYALTRYGNGDPRSWRAIKAKRAWLAGRMSFDKLHTSRLAAESAAWSAAESAARSAAASEARSAVAAASAAWSAAAASAALSAASAARSAAAASAAWSAAASAVRSAVWSAARSAEWSAAGGEINCMVESYIRDYNYI